MSDERVSGLISGLSQSARSYGRTDGLTEISSTASDQSFTSVPRAHVRPDQQIDSERRRFAPADDDPELIGDTLPDAWFIDYQAAFERQPVVRRGDRETLCWHLRSMVKQRDDYRCRWCGGRHRELQIDHLTPWSAGGTSDTRNLQVLCDEHNAAKGNRLDAARAIAPGVVVECIRCRDPHEPPRGDAVWCFTCRQISHDRPAWIDLAQRFLLGHCEEILRPKSWSREVALYERERLLRDWELWSPDARAAFERELRDRLRDVALELREFQRGIADGLPQVRAALELDAAKRAELDALRRRDEPREDARV